MSEPAADAVLEEFAGWSCPQCGLGFMDLKPEFFPYVQLCIGSAVLVHCRICGAKRLYNRESSTKLAQGLKSA